jgi:iron complex transport system ATP-binding protein
MKLRAQDLGLGYGPLEVIEDLSLDVDAAEMVALIGPNGCGKSTLLRGVGRLLRPRTGVVLLDNRDIHRTSTKKVARTLAVITQTSEGAPDLTVEELVWRGRYPHQTWLQGASRHDSEVVERSIDQCDLHELRGRRLAELSGGELQRAWLAMALAQEPQVLLLDEPTSFLDYYHQLEVMDLLADLNSQGLTIVMAMHDLNQVARYSRRVIALRDGRIFRDDAPPSVLTPEVLRQVFGVDAYVFVDEATGQLVCLPYARSDGHVPLKNHNNRKR